MAIFSILSYTLMSLREGARGFFVSGPCTYKKLPQIHSPNPL